MSTINRRQALVSLSLPALAALSPALATASTAWPTKPVRLVIPAPPGGGSDAVGRLIGDQLGKALGQPFIMDNKPGANGVLASEAVMRATDQHTLLFSFAGAIAVSPFLYKRAPDPLKALAPIAQVGAMGNVLLASPKLPVTNLKELVAYAKANPISYGSWGQGSGGHLTMEDFLDKAKIKMTHAPYKGVSAVVTDLLGNNLPVGWCDAASVIQHVQSGKLRALAVSGPTRMATFPGVATMREQGYPFDTTSWYGLFAPANTDPAIQKRLNELVVGIIKQPAMRERLAALNLPDLPNPDVAGFRRTVGSDMQVWGGIVKRLGIEAV